MRFRFLLSVLSFALLTIVGWSRHDTSRDQGPPLPGSSDGDTTLFVG